MRGYIIERAARTGPVLKHRPARILSRNSPPIRRPSPSDSAASAAPSMVTALHQPVPAPSFQPPFQPGLFRHPLASAEAPGVLLAVLAESRRSYPRQSGIL